MDQIKLGLEALSRIESELRSPPKDDAPVRASALPYSADNPPVLRELLDEMGPLPPCSMVIGACEDRAHLFLDLRDARPGSILIVADEMDGPARLLRAMLASLAAVNSPRHVRYALIGDLEPEAQALTEFPHFYRHHWPSASKASDLIVELADLVESRSKAQQDWSAVVLAIDDLAGFLAYLDDETVAQLAWLAANGPAVRVWTLATLGAGEFSALDEDLLDAFGTHLIGKIEQQALADELCGSDKARPRALQAGSQFGVIFGDTWISFWVPDAGFSAQETNAV
ncbi:MAG: hypothetical protein ACOYYS_02790 [Chloroflexota bacterium]